MLQRQPVTAPQKAEASTATGADVAVPKEKSKLRDALTQLFAV